MDRRTDRSIALCPLYTVGREYNSELNCNNISENLFKVLSHDKVTDFVLRRIGVFLFTELADVNQSVKLYFIRPKEQIKHSIKQNTKREGHLDVLELIETTIEQHAV